MDIKIERNFDLELEDPEYSLTCTVRVQVQDVNDIAPEFTNVPTGQLCTHEIMQE